jgi:hypothetical protein
MTDAKITDRGRRRGAYVLVVHDPTVPVTTLCEALKTRFIVRSVDTVFAALERLPEPSLGCVICVLGGSVRAADFFDLAVRVSPKHAARTIFIVRHGLPIDDTEFLDRSAVTWLPERTKNANLLSVVHAVMSLPVQ